MGQPKTTQEPMHRDAQLSPDGLYRYRLDRRWGGVLTGQRVLWVMLNPSTADHRVDDPTIRRCIAFSRRERFDELRVLNLWARRSATFTELVSMDSRQRYGQHEVDWEHEADQAQRVIVAWGRNIERVPDGRKRAAYVLSKLRSARSDDVLCLGHTRPTAGGYRCPRHPLYINGQQPLIPYNEGVPL